MCKMIEIAMMLPFMVLNEGIYEKYVTSDGSKYRIHINTNGSSYYFSIRTFDPKSKELKYTSGFMFCFKSKLLQLGSGDHSLELNWEEIQDIKNNFMNDGKLNEVDYVLAYGRSKLSFEYSDYLYEELTKMITSISKNNVRKSV